MRLANGVALSVAGAILLAGCRGRLSPGPSAAAPLRRIDAAGLARSLEGHRGQVVLVDFWATWCGPCLELFPHAAELQRRLGAKGLVVFTVSLDDPGNEPAVRRFLDKQQAGTENFLAVYGVGPEAFTAFGIEDGALPHVRLYDRRGKLHRDFASGGQTIDPRAIERAVEQMLE